MSVEACTSSESSDRSAECRGDVASTREYVPMTAFYSSPGQSDVLLRAEGRWPVTANATKLPATRAAAAPTRSAAVPRKTSHSRIARA